MHSQVSQCESAGDGVEMSEVQADHNRTVKLAFVQYECHTSK